MKDKPPSVLIATKDNDFFPNIENRLLRFCLYSAVWLIGTALMILPAAAIVNIILK